MSGILGASLSAITGEFDTAAAVEAIAVERDMQKATEGGGEKKVDTETRSSLSRDLAAALQREESITFKSVDVNYLRKAAATEQSS